ncbi:hypothetical protein J532_4583, partial [Acinetobacter baumannii 940793]
DTSNIEDYHLRAGLHCQSVLADRRSMAGYSFTISR